MCGWVKLHRNIMFNPTVCKDSDHFAVWSYLLLNATHKEVKGIFGKEEIILKRGQQITGRKVISDKFKISESKVQRILKSFENAHQIEQQTSNKNRLITILNWELYQEDEQQIKQPVNNKRTTSEQQVNTYKNVKNIKNVKNDKKYIYIKNVDNVKLTQEQYDSLVDEYGKDVVDVKILDMDNYVAQKNKPYKDYNKALRTWIRKDNRKGNDANEKYWEQFNAGSESPTFTDEDIQRAGLI